MKVTTHGNVFSLLSKFEEKDIPKRAGFRWHGRDCRNPCRACGAAVPRNVWWTDSEEKLAALVRHHASATGAKSPLEFTDPATEALATGRAEVQSTALEASRASAPVAGIKIPCPRGLAYLPYQEAGIAFALAHPSVLFGDEMGLGKGQPVDSKLLTPTGWRRLGDVKVGDKVIGSQGTAVTVTGVFPRGVLPVFKVCFNDKTSLVVDGDHLWAVRSNNQQFKGSAFCAKETRALATDLTDAAGNSTWRIPVVEPVHFPSDVKLPIDPYLLGVLISDKGKSISGVRFCCGDEGVPVEVKKVLPTGCSLMRHDDPTGEKTTYWSITTSPAPAPNPVLDACRTLGLGDVGSPDRRIPQEYLLASVEDRLSLLQGLLDTDGEIRGDHVGHDTSSEGLREDVAFLVQSLGGIARRRFRAEPKYTHNGEVRIGLPSYRLTISLPAGTIGARALAHRWPSFTKYTPNRVIRSIEPAGKKEVICISVDAPDHLYVTENFIVTHNTVQAIGTVNSDTSVKTVLVLCPASLKLNWKRELEKWLTRDFSIHVVAKKVAAGGEHETADVVVANYDRLIGKPGRVLHDALMARSWDVVIADECHFLKNPKSQRTIAVLGKPGKWDKETRTTESGTPGLISRARRRLFLTGTPILNRPIEVHPLLAAIAPAEFGNFFSFAKRYCAAAQGRYGWDFSGASHLDELQERLRMTCMVRRLKADVLKDLPAKRHSLVTLAVEDGEVRKLLAREVALQAQLDGAADGETDPREEHLAERAEMASVVGDAEGFAEAVARLSTYRADPGDAEDDWFEDDYDSRQRRRNPGAVAFTEIADVRHRIALLKVPSAIEHLDAILEEGVEKVVAFAHHRDVVAALADHYGQRAVSVTGSTPMALRQEAVDRFQNDPSVLVFLGNIQAAGVGLTLTAASNVVFVEQSWVPAMNVQAEDRCHRIGQRDSVNVQYLVLDGSLDAKVAAVCIEKQGVADAALDDARAALRVAEPVKVKVAASGRVSPAKKTYPVATPEQRHLAKLAMRSLASVCDGAREKDEMGFSGADTHFGHKLAAVEGDLTDGQTYFAIKLARKYRRQLSTGIVEGLGVGAKSE